VTVIPAVVALAATRRPHGRCRSRSGALMGCGQQDLLSAKPEICSGRCRHWGWWWVVFLSSRERKSMNEAEDELPALMDRSKGEGQAYRG
jgi:hypothetical protein